MAEPKTREELLFEQFAQGKRPSHPDVKALIVDGAKIKSNTIYRYFQAFKRSIGPDECARLFPENEAPKAIHIPSSEKELADSIKTAEELAEGTAKGTAEEIAGKTETKEERAVKALRKAQAKGDSVLRSTTIPSEAVIVTIIPKQFTMTTTKLWSAMKATIERWGWPADISPSEWLDKYLEITMKQRDIGLDTYHVIQPGESGGNGEHEAQEPEIDWEIEAQSYDRVDQEALVRAASASEE
jgi:hypothetical protein